MSHAYHIVFLRTLRVALDVEVPSGKEHACLHGLSNLWRVWQGEAPAGPGVQKLYAFED